MLSSGLCLLWVFLSLPILQHFMTSFPLLVLPCHFLITIIFLPYRLYSFLAASSTSFLTYLPSIFLLFVHSCFHPSFFHSFTFPSSSVCPTPGFFLSILLLTSLLSVFLLLPHPCLITPYLSPTVFCS